MKTLFLTLSFIIFYSCLEAQTPYKQKKRKKDFFGKRENPNDKVRPIGIQLQLGLTHTFTKKKNVTVQSPEDAATRYQFVQDPIGKPGIYAEIGMVHFNMKEPKFKFGRFIDYVDYGIGFKLITGREETTFDYFDPTGKVMYSETGVGEFSNGYVYARLAIHKLQYINKTKKLFLDHSLGINGDYLLLGGSENYKAPVVAYNQYFSKPFVMNLHYGLGFGIRLKKGSYLVPGVQLPFLGIQEWNKGNPTLRWFSSNYYPVMFQIKYIRLFPAKKGKGCYEGDPADKKRNEEYMQNR